MPCENSARKRSKTMAFRCTPEEYELIASMAAWSGMSRQDYIMARLTGTEITVRPSSRTQRALRDSMKGLAERLLAVCDADELDEGLQKQLALVMEIFNGLGEAPTPERRSTRERGHDDFFGMSRR
ncbi:plasmid mobilization protein [Collinsella sp. LCP19S3_B11]|uniref:plasmid mobilization protein n=1 Tax=Collinsella sp. LCP19S3_B11 TaxID=3438754 RepID=UPI003F93D53B